MIFEHALIMMPITLIIGGLVFGVLNSDYFMVALAVGMSICFILSETVKKFLPFSDINKRPTDNACKCRLCPSDCPNSPAIGMPSTHAAVMSFFFMLILLRNGGQINLQVILAFLLAIAVMYQRYASLCHSPLQLLAGAILGSVLGYYYSSLVM